VAESSRLATRCPSGVWMLRFPRSWLALLVCMPTSWACIALTAAGCREDALTQLVVVVDSDWDGFERAEIAVERFADDVTIDVERRGGKPLLPRRLALVHDGGELGPIHVTVRGFAGGSDQPVLVEPRRDLYFERGKTRMLKVVLHYECIGDCAAGQACLGDQQCVAADDERVTELVPWDSDVDPIDVTHRGKPLDAGQRDAGDPPDGEGGVDAAPEPTDGGGDADGPVDGDAAPPPLDFPYEPSNFDPLAPAIADAAREDVVLDCEGAEFDSTSRTFTNWCQDAVPATVIVEQSGGSEAVVVVMGALQITTGAALHLTGERPVILAVFGDARIDGSIDASASGTTSGPGGERDCAGGRGAAGDDSDYTIGLGAGGGGGGGFGTSGGNGGRGGVVASETAAQAAGGDAVPPAMLVPLRGGCAGGTGGDGSGGAGGNGGGAGGAVQLSVAGLLELNGPIDANGGGGAAGTSALSGGGGGGSGGAIALEAATLEITDAAVLSANGGAGGAGQSGTPTDAAASAGADGSSGTGAAAGGSPEGAGGRGGDGAATAAAVEVGSEGGATSSYGYGGGGGGGGLGRIRARGADACALPGVWSPRPVVECAACGVCPSEPSSDCQPFDHDSRMYFRCSAPLAWDEAKASCEAAGLQLVRVEDQAENDALAAGTSEDTWIGASDVAIEADWRWTDGTAFWSGTEDGASVSGRYEAWASGALPQPDNTTPNGMTNADCALMDTDGAWADRSCIASHPYLCEP